MTVYEVTLNWAADGGLHEVQTEIEAPTSTAALAQALDLLSSKNPDPRSLAVRVRVSHYRPSKEQLG